MNELYLIAPSILHLIVIVSSLLDRWSVPVILIALGAGILFGSDVLRLWDFGNVTLTNQIANLALVFILFQGGFSTKREDFKSVALPAGGLATWGVILTAITTFIILRFVLHWQLEKSILLAVIISSTDAAATFSILRRQSLPSKLSATVEIESAANDPMAILLTMAAIQALTVGNAQWEVIALSFAWKFSAGIGIGWLLGHSMTWLFNIFRPQDRGHYYIMLVGAVMLIFGLAEAAQSSAMLAIFVAGFVMGNKPFVHKQGIANFISALSTIADTSMFVLMGLLVYPHQWADLWIEGIVIFAVLTFIARPFAVWIGTMMMGLGVKNKIFITWAGLRGAVPIILATYPITAGMAEGNEIFNLVFFVVILSVTFQGSTLGTLAKALKISTKSRPKPLYNLELITMAKSDMDLITVDIPGPQGSQYAKISDLRLPPGSVITLITRGEKVVAPKGSTCLRGWDQITILTHAANEATIKEILTCQVNGTIRGGDIEQSCDNTINKNGACGNEFD